MGAEALPLSRTASDKRGPVGLETGSTPTPATEHHTLQEGSELQGGHAGLTVGGPWTGRKAGPFERRSERIGQQSGRQHPGPGQGRGPRGEDREASLGAPPCSHLPPAYLQGLRELEPGVRSPGARPVDLRRALSEGRAEGRVFRFGTVLQI